MAHLYTRHTHFCFLLKEDYPDVVENESQETIDEIILLSLEKYNSQSIPPDRTMPLQSQKTILTQVIPEVIEIRKRRGNVKSAKRVYLVK